MTIATAHELQHAATAAWSYLGRWASPDEVQTS
jgi:hypothetical protein